MKIAPNLNFTVVEPTKKSLESFVQMIKNVYQNFTQAFNGQIGFGDGTNLDNINGSWINVVAPGAPNTDFTVSHNLQRIPSGYWIMAKDRACDVYTGSVAATSTQITLRATVASAVLRLFIVGILLCIFSTRSSAQGAYHQNIAIKTVTPSGSTGISGPLLQPISSAIITVCNGSTLPVAGATCTGLASIFSNITLTQALSNPTNADIFGNYAFYATAGQNYVISVAGTGLTTYSYVWTSPPALTTGQNAINLYSLDNIRVIDGCAGVSSPKYPCTTAGLAAANADVLTQGGGKIIIPPGQTMTISSCPVQIGNVNAAAPKPVTLEVYPVQGFPTFNVTCTGGPDTFQFGDSSGMIGNTSSNNAPVITVAATANVATVLAPLDRTGQQESFLFRDIGIKFTAGATVTSAVVDFTSMADNTEVSRVITAGSYTGGGVCMLIAPGSTSGGGPIRIVHNWCDASTNNNIAYKFTDSNGTNFTSSVYAYANEAQNTGTGACVSMQATTVGHIRQVIVDGFTCTLNTTTKQFDIFDCWFCQFKNIQTATNAGSGVTGIFFETKINGSIGNRIENLFITGAGYTNAFNDTNFNGGAGKISGNTSSSGYYYQQPGYASGAFPVQLYGGVQQIQRQTGGMGTPVVSGDFGSLSATWGTTASVPTQSGSDSSGSVTVNSNGTGQGQNPSITFTFHDGTWTNAPFCTAWRADTNAPTAATITAVTTATTLVMTFNNTPVAGTGYTMRWKCEGQ